MRFKSSIKLVVQVKRIMGYPTLEDIENRVKLYGNGNQQELKS